jgi:hypothetical protein
MTIPGCLCDLDKHTYTPDPGKRTTKHLRGISSREPGSALSARVQRCHPASEPPRCQPASPTATLSSRGSSPACLHAGDRRGICFSPFDRVEPFALRVGGERLTVGAALFGSKGAVFPHGSGLVTEGASALPATPCHPACERRISLFPWLTPPPDRLPRSASLVRAIPESPATCKSTPGGRRCSCGIESAGGRFRCQAEN